MKVSNDVINILADSTTDGPCLFLPGYLDRNVYKKVDEALQAIGGKWNRKAKAHVFKEDAEALVTQVVAIGEVVSLKKDYNFFPTPIKLAEFVVELAAFTEEGLHVLEPSAGQGALIMEMPDHAVVSCVELHQGNADHLRKFLGLSPVEADFMQLEPANIGYFDRIVMNPPFSKMQDVDHVMQALRFLKPGGRLVAIMSPSWQYVQTKKAQGFRELIESSDCVVHEIEAGVFKESGTMIRTVVLEYQN